MDIAAISSHQHMRICPVAFGKGNVEHLSYSKNTQSFTLHHRKPARTAQTTNKKQDKDEKQDLIGQRLGKRQMYIIGLLMFTLAVFLRKIRLVSF
jgi:hypothetical protein